MVHRFVIYQFVPGIVFFTLAKISVHDLSDNCLLWLHTRLKSHHFITNYKEKAFEINIRVSDLDDFR